MDNGCSMHLLWDITQSVTEKNFLSPNINSDVVTWPFPRRHTMLQLIASFPSKLSYWKSCLYPYVLLLFWIYFSRLTSASVTLFSALREQANLLIHDIKCCLQMMFTLLTIYIVIQFNLPLNFFKHTNLIIWHLHIFLLSVLNCTC